MTGKAIFILLPLHGVGSCSEEPRWVSFHVILVWIKIPSLTVLLVAVLYICIIFWFHWWKSSSCVCAPSKAGLCNGTTSVWKVVEINKLEYANPAGWGSSWWLSSGFGKALIQQIFPDKITLSCFTKGSEGSWAQGNNPTPKSMCRDCWGGVSRAGVWLPLWILLILAPDFSDGIFSSTPQALGMAQGQGREQSWDGNWCLPNPPGCVCVPGVRARAPGTSSFPCSTWEEAAPSRFRMDKVLQALSKLMGDKENGWVSQMRCLF